MIKLRVKNPTKKRIIHCLQVEYSERYPQFWSSDHWMHHWVRPQRDGYDRNGIWFANFTKSNFTKRARPVKCQSTRTSRTLRVAWSKTMPLSTCQFGTFEITANFAGLFEINYLTSNFIWTCLVTAAGVAAIIARNLLPASGGLTVGRNNFICVVAL